VAQPMYDRHAFAKLAVLCHCPPFITTDPMYCKFSTARTVRGFANQNASTTFPTACLPVSPVMHTFLLLQHAREEEIAERKAMKRAERDIARKKEYVRRVRLQIEDKRAEVSAVDQICPCVQLSKEHRSGHAICMQHHQCRSLHSTMVA